jgi:hypothetical protein
VVTVGVAAGLVIALLGLVTSLAWLAIAALAPLGYLAGVIVASLTHARDLPLRSLLLLPAVFATMHLAWGTGYLRGIG